MVEVGRAVARDDLVDKTHLTADLLLEFCHIGGLVSLGKLREILLGEFVPLHVEDRRGAKLGGHEALVELPGIVNLGHEGVRNDLTGLVMLGIFSENLRLESPVLIKLRECLHEVTGDIGSADGRIVALCEKSVEGVAELVEHSLDLINGKEGRERVGRSRHVADVDDDRANVIALGVNILLTEVRHPRAASLRRAREIVGREYSKKTSVRVNDLEGLDGRVVERNILQRLDGDAVKLVGGEEYAVADILHPEIWLRQILVQ